MSAENDNTNNDNHREMEYEQFQDTEDGDGTRYYDTIDEYNDSNPSQASLTVSQGNIVLNIPDQNYYVNASTPHAVTPSMSYAQNTINGNNNGNMRVSDREFGRVRFRRDNPAVRDQRLNDNANNSPRIRSRGTNNSTNYNVNNDNRSNRAASEPLSSNAGNQFAPPMHSTRVPYPHGETDPINELDLRCQLEEERLQQMRMEIARMNQLNEQMRLENHSRMNGLHTSFYWNNSATTLRYTTNYELYATAAESTGDVRLTRTISYTKDY